MKQKFELKRKNIEICHEMYKKTKLNFNDSKTHTKALITLKPEYNSNIISD